MVGELPIPTLVLLLLHSFIKTLYNFYPNKDAQTQNERDFGDQLHSVHKPNNVEISHTCSSFDFCAQKALASAGGSLFMR